MKHKYANEGKKDKNKYLNNPPIINNKEFIKLNLYQLNFQKCKNNSLKICSKMIKLCNIHAAIESIC